jgi:hypothetical protein
MAVKGGIKRDWQDKLTGCSFMFGGLNNVLDPYNLDIDKGDLAEAINVDIDNTNSISRRDGYSLITSTTTGHSGWSDGVISLYADGQYLKRFDGTTSTNIDVITTGLHMYYCKANDVVVYSNGIESGIVGGDFTQTSVFSPDFKFATDFGICLEFQNGRVYHAKENSVFCTDVFDAEHTDIRHSLVLTVRSKITMIKRVEGGLFVGSEQQTHFLKGNDIQEGGFDLVIIADYGVIPRTDVASVGEYFPESKASGPIAVWTSKRGICTGGANGHFINHSLGIVSIPEANQGAALIRDANGYRQYITTLMGSTTEYNPYPAPTFDVDTI